MDIQEEVEKLMKERYNVYPCNTGGGVYCFVFVNEVRELTIGYASGRLGWGLQNWKSDSMISGEKPTDIPDTPENDVEYILTLLQVFGFNF